MTVFRVERELEIGQIGNRLKEIARTIYQDVRDIGPWEMCLTGTGRGPEKPPARGWKRFAVPMHWGAEGVDITAWFRATTSVPCEWKGKAVVLLLRPGGESLCYLNGKPFQGLSVTRDEILLSNKARGGEKLDILIEAVNTPYVDPGRVTETTFEYARLAIKDLEIAGFYRDASVAWDVLRLYPEESNLQQKFLRMLAPCVKMVDLQDGGGKHYRDSIRKAREALAEGLQKFPADVRDGRMLLVGHTHIDTAWLWPIRETKRKCARTVSSMLKYLEEYPDFLFSYSQPQQYAYLKEYYPDLYNRIHKWVKSGRWECLGASWIEQDNHCTSGESIIRQLLYGNGFFEKEFGVRSRVEWLPDAFGYNWAMPQILKKAGVDYFATTKLSWNVYNRFPYTLFWWEGIDGTRVLSIMIEGTYNIELEPKTLLEHWGNFRSKDLAPEQIASFGWGDGGGGPTREMIEIAARLTNIAGMPKCRFGKVQEYFETVEKEVPLDKLPVWKGELYLELHRACQTTQSRTKRLNRLCEIALRHAEIFSTRNMMMGGGYESEQLQSRWLDVLLNQFHDILPGSSVRNVYEDTEAQLGTALANIEQISETAQKELVRKIDTRGSGNPIVVLNTLSWSHTGLVSVDLDAEGKESSVLDSRGQPQPVQIVSNEDGLPALLFLANDVPSMGHEVYSLLQGNGGKANAKARRNSERLPGGREANCEDLATVTGRALCNPIEVSNTRLEHDYFVIDLSPDGDLTQIYDKRQDRDVLEQGKHGNVFQLFDDRPWKHDAWDFDHNFEEQMWSFDPADSIEVLESGPVRARVRIRRRTRQSTLVQDIIVYSHIPRIDFETQIEWWEKRVLLKVAFPLHILSPRATYEIQFGAIERPTSRNHSWERAQFEVPAQRWADLSEGNYGVSLLNDCKYGYDCRDNVLRLTLLRSPIIPDPQADEGTHRFTYSLYPHAGDWRMGETVRRAAELNNPLRAVRTSRHTGEISARYSWIQIHPSNVVLDTVKKAEVGDDVILRFYESLGYRGPVKITFSEKPKKVWECNLIERNEKRVSLVDGNTVVLPFSPFEVKTVRVAW
ncbi:MAG TPA: glycoside hydrolase family 38 C-terminal domain-containing protein [bacterium]|nr:glycoside hydrolase family 38 C-terminal domain-containing protein [bacterium]HQL62451.1 glycoside hydrolase family 38 C-terminal domain-containing protein [bacterium]